MGKSPDLELLHTRDYQVQSFRTTGDNLLIRGAVRDSKPPNLYWPTDPEIMVIHHMIVELDVTFGSMVITGARVIFETHPHQQCPAIIDHYQQLVGVSIARGYTHKVRELFGGPRGCSHTTALLQAMAPVAMQSGFSMRSAQLNDGSYVAPGENTGSKSLLAPINTCHVWSEDGDLAEQSRTGQFVEVPIPMARRLKELGVDPIEFRRRGR